MELEERRIREEEELKRTKEQMERARLVAQEEAALAGTAPGMVVQEVVDEDESAEANEVSEVPAKKIPERKTKAERRKAEKLRAEVRSTVEGICLLPLIMLAETPSR